MKYFRFTLHKLYNNKNNNHNREETKQQQGPKRIKNNV